MHLRYRFMPRLIGLSICVLLLELKLTIQFTDNDIGRYR